MKKKFLDIKYIQNYLTYIPPLFFILLMIIALVVTYSILENRLIDQKKLIIQQYSFDHQKELSNYIHEIESRVHTVFDDEENRIIKTIYMLKGEIESQKFESLDQIRALLKLYEHHSELGIVLFDTQTLNILYGEEIIDYLRTLTNSNVKTQEFYAHILKNIHYIGKENLQYWIDNKRRKIQLSYFESIEGTDLYIGLFSKVGDLKLLARELMISSIPSKSLAIDGYYWLHDYRNEFVYNFKNKNQMVKIKELSNSLKDELKSVDQSIYKTNYDFPKYQYSIGINSEELIQKRLGTLEDEFKEKKKEYTVVIVSIGLSLTIIAILFARFIARNFARHDRRISFQNRLFKAWRDRYKLAIIASNDGFIDINFKTNKVYLSNQWHEMFGFDRSEISTFEDWFNLIHQEDQSTVQNILNEHMQNESKNFICEYRYKTKSGSYHWVLSRGKLFRDKEGVASRMIMVSMSINERKNLSKELEYIDLLVNVGRMVIFKAQCNDTLNMDYLSHSITSYGYRKEEIDSYWQIVHEDDRALLKEKIEYSLEHNQTSFSLTYRVYEKSKDIKWVFNRTILLKDHDGKITHLFGYINDITQMKINEQELQHRIDEEVQKNIQKDRILAHQSKLASMGEMIGNIAHQWRQPLNNVNLLIHLLRDNHKNMSEEELNEIILQSKTQIDFMSQTIDDFRNFYQPNKDKSHFNIKKSIKEAYKVVKTDFEKTQIDFNVNGDEVEAFNYENEFQQVIVNILNNANDAAILKLEKVEFQPEVKINIYKFQSTVVISIRNNCGKASKEVLERMFEAYFTTKFENIGTGIGLYMSKTIIERNMNGTISVDNENDGVRFTIVLAL